MIKLKDDYVIRADSLSFMLCKDTKKLDKDGNTKWDIKGYYPNLTLALESYCSKRMADRIGNNDMTLLDVKNLIKDLKAEISAYDINMEEL